MRNIFILVLLSWCNGEDDHDAKILQLKIENDNPKKYHFKFETSNGIYREEYGELVLSESNEEIMVVHGKYSYMGSDGSMYIVKYTADDNGYVVENIDKDTGTYTTPFISKGISGNAIKSLQGGGLG
ncbi:hypothetical protein RI129_003667 [Pyrocoelia pectoralis]|uniref:Uncharacterized protein n=1 Tax=Pyrocoelia pectoralis TaxID=417401 RepID=A0AAN7VHB9_9COLE